jgi:hypothetical protein
MHRVQPARATRLLAAARPTGRTYANPTLALGTQTWVTHALGQHGPNGVASRTPSRPIFNLFNRLTGRESKPAPPPQPVPVLSQDDLFHPFSKSPFPAIRARGEAISQMAPCPVCSSEHGHEHGHTHGHGSGNENKNAAEQTETDLENELENGPLRPKPTPVKTVKFECPDCGWPTHCSEEHWKADPEHEKYCARLREVNEDEHDLRSGRRIREFELPGMLVCITSCCLSISTAIHKCLEHILIILFTLAEQDSEAAISFSNWDVFWYTRQFPSMDTERARRHASKLLTYPMTIGSILHQYSGLTLSNQRLTPEGSRSLAGKFHDVLPPRHFPVLFSPSRIELILTKPLSSTPFDTPRQTRHARDRRSRRRQAPSPSLHPRRPGRVELASTRVGAAHDVVPVGANASAFHRTAGVVAAGAAATAECWKRFELELFRWI